MKHLCSLKTGLGMAILVGVALSPCAAGVLPDPVPVPKVTPPALHDQMRLVYEDQILWTRMLALGVFDELKGKQAYGDRLFENYEACERVLAPYYKDGAEKLGTLLEVHIELTEKVFEEMKAGDTFRTVLPFWYANGDEIATLMTELNPKYWPRKETMLYWRMYLDITLDGAIAHQKGDWRGEVAAYDALHLHALKLADFMSDGIRRHFDSPLPSPIPELDRRVVK